MKSNSVILIGIFVFFFVVAGLVFFSKISTEEKKLVSKQKISKKALFLASPAFDENGFIPEKYTCDGENINPPFVIKNIPSETKSLAIVVNDPDAPSGNFIHWVIWNINPQESKIQEGILPNGAVEGVNDFGNIGYGGPCPPDGVHHYQFRLFALSKKLSLSRGASKKQFENFARDSIIQSFTLTAKYKRK